MCEVGTKMRPAVDIYKAVQEYELRNVSVIIGESTSLNTAQKADMYFQKNNVPLSFVSCGMGAGYYKDIETESLMEYFDQFGLVRWAALQ